MNILTKKKCLKCGIEKLYGEFSFNKLRRDGRQSECKECCKKRFSGWYLKNIEKAKEQAYKWQIKNKEKRKKINHRWYKANTKKIKENNRKWVEANPEKCREYFRRYERKLRATPKGKLSNNISRAIRFSLRNNKKGWHWESLVGYTIDDLKNHLEKQFKDGMTWDNQGFWHIDHIIPVSVFNFDNPSNLDFKRCWALKNLRPLWSKDNISKQNKLNQLFQPSLRI